MAALPSFVFAGNVVNFRIRTRDDAAQLQDPTAVTCKFGLAGEEGTPLTVSRVAKGDHRASWDTTGLEGTYWIKGLSTGSLRTAREIRIKVLAPHIT